MSVAATPATETVLRTVQNYVNGALVDSVATEFTELVDPTDGTVTGRSPKSTPEEVDAAVRAAEAAFPGWRRTTPSQRQLMLLQLADAIEAHSDELVELQSRNTGQVKALIASEEVAVGADHLRFFAGAARMLEGKASGEYMTGLSSSVRREPIGVVAQVTPWNYPLMMALWKIGPALAAGNTVVLKPSDTTPESTVLLAQLAGEIFPPGVFNVVNGDGQTGKVLVEHPVPGLVAITGSVRAGISVAVSAAQHLKRAHLELGGKAPVVVFADADLASAAAGIATAGYFNAGQDCTAATRVIVHESVHDAFVDALVAEAAQTRPGGRDDEDAAYGPLNNAAHFAKVTGMLADLPAHAQIRTGGRQVGSEGFYLEPTVITGLQQDDQCIQEEIFGPVITVQSFTDEADALARANGVPYGLSSSVWTTDHATALRMSRDLDFGCVWVNTHIPLVAEMPHGGFGASGYGKDLSGYGLEDYTRVKHVMSALG
ncbi:gamma-aminobutyraldehyde dehydrogenase [uncultured Friedmanniella sp.]|uniref:gamma-aminobutyraldehyde dehydrogenase n=1 Tax=uncultured Friedmanniella sp. TaxID=335381 RepID=UPI0035CAAD2D